jgi:quinol monooxygenase YgiN
MARAVDRIRGKPARESENEKKVGGNMVKVGLFVRMEAKPGKEKEVESFLKGGRALVDQEPATTAWFAIRLGPSTFGIFDVFADDSGRQAHLTGAVAKALMAKASDLFSKPPSIEKTDVLAAKLKE